MSLTCTEFLNTLGVTMEEVCRFTGLAEGYMIYTMSRETLTKIAHEILEKR